MASKIIKHGLSARSKLIEGINILANTVKTTLGPNGKYVVIDKGYGTPIVTNDGVTVAKSIELEDKELNLGAKLIKEASEKTDENVGDGTTTTAIVVQEIVNEGEKSVALGQNPFLITKGMEYAKNVILENLEKNKRNVTSDDEIVSIATISASDEKIGKEIASLIKRVGPNGKATIESGSKFETEIDVIEGIHFDSGFAAPFMVTDQKANKAEYKDSKVLIYEGKINDIRDIVNVLEEIIQNRDSLVIMANEFSEEFLATILVNTLQGGLKLLAIKNPGFGDSRHEELEDIAIYLGTKVFNEKDKLSEIKASDLGEVKTIKATKNQTILIGGSGSKETIDGRIDLIKSQLSNEKNSDLEKRLAKLTGGIGVIKVGASTESELKSKQYRYEDSLNAALAALENGVVEGGGMALLKASRNINIEHLSFEEKLGVSIIQEALEVPVKQIINNSGLNGDIILQKIVENDYKNGFDSSKHEYVDMFKQGIIDPTNVVKNIISNAVSIASLVLITDAIVTDSPKKTE